jgi:hypothetical protein
MVEAGELNRYGPLMLRKLLILRSAKSSETSTKAEVRYTAAIRHARVPMLPT